MTPAKFIQCSLLIIFIFCFTGAFAAENQQTKLESTVLPTQGSLTLTPALLQSRKMVAQSELDNLNKLNDKSPDQAELKKIIEETLTLLNNLENLLQRKTILADDLTNLEKNLREAKEKKNKLANPSPKIFEQVTEEVRGEYINKLDNTRLELEKLIRAAVDGEVRLASIPKELEQLHQNEVANEQLLNQFKTDVENKPNDPLARHRLEYEELNQQRLQLEMTTLEVEREWLIKRTPLQDARISLVQAQLQQAQADVAQIQKSLGQVLKEQQVGLKVTAASIAKKMQATLDPVQAQILKVTLATVKIRQKTADYREALSELSSELLNQEKLTSTARQTFDRLRTLVKKYAAGEAPAQRVFLLFERLRRDRSRLSEQPLEEAEAKLRKLNGSLFTIDDRLYEFDENTEEKIQELTKQLGHLAENTQEQARNEILKLRNEQKIALRERQQALVALTQDTEKLVGLEKEQRRALDDGYLFALNNIFWIRDSDPVSLETVIDGNDGIHDISTTLGTYLRDNWREIRKQWQEVTSSLWMPILAILVLLPLTLKSIDQKLSVWIKNLLKRQDQITDLADLSPAILILLRSALWPGYLALTVWIIKNLLVISQTDVTVSQLFLSALHLGIFTVWIGISVTHLFRIDGWAQKFWQLQPRHCRIVVYAVQIACAAALLFLVPRHILLGYPGDPEANYRLHALARILFISFQSSLLFLILLLTRKNGPFMQELMNVPENEHDLVWQIQRWLPLLLTFAVLVDIGLDVMGYSYAASFLWFKCVQTVLVLVLFTFVIHVIAHRYLLNFLNLRFTTQPLVKTNSVPQDMLGSVQWLASIALKLLLAGIALVIIFEIWGVSVLWTLSSNGIYHFLLKLLMITGVALLAYVVTRSTKKVSNYLLEPKLTRSGHKLNPGRKLQTLMPLVQTLIEMVMIFLAFLGILEIIGIATAPLLAGVGIFGLAIGFAAQSLIKDFINGLFILFEGSLAVGDTVQLHGIGGQVEKFTLRAVTIRDMSGNVHIIPNSAIDIVTNMTKGYSRYVVDIGVSYKENIDEIINLFRQIDKEMHEETEFAQALIDTLEVLGVERFDETAIIIRVRFKTKPGEQWRIGREFRRRVKLAFDVLGKELPVPQPSVYIASGIEKVTAGIN